MPINYGYKGATELVKLIKEIHGFSPDEMYRITGYPITTSHPLFGITIINIYCEYDPFVYRYTHNKYVQSHHEAFDNMNVINIKKLRIGHCSDMAFDTEYIKDIVLALSL